MIKTGIIGGETWQAGELIRILIHHPEVELMAVSSPALKGRAVASHHPGLIGDTKLTFTDKVDFKNLDAIFVANDAYEAELEKIAASKPEMRIVNLSPLAGLEVDGHISSLRQIPAISELFRKPMVRGNHYARVFDPGLTVMLIMLFPLAAHLLLTDNIRVVITSHDESRAERRSSMRMPEAVEILQAFQRSFPGNISLTHLHSDIPRKLNVVIEMDNAIPLSEIEKAYDNIYDDHNFTFVIDKKVSHDEVAGSHKCLINISKPDEKTLRIEGEADALLRGGAGDAVHAMNLMFGLYEKIGLNLKTVSSPCL